MTCSLIKLRTIAITATWLTCALLVAPDMQFVPASTSRLPSHKSVVTEHAQGERAPQVVQLTRCALEPFMHALE
jgi:hypothetical protein